MLTPKRIPVKSPSPHPISSQSPGTYSSRAADFCLWSAHTPGTLNLALATALHTYACYTPRVIVNAFTPPQPSQWTAAQRELRTLLPVLQLGESAWLPEARRASPRRGPCLMHTKNVSLKREGDL